MRRPELIARQSACPSGVLGRLIGRIMAVETAEANRIAVELLDLVPTDHVLEIGFGHGATIARMAATVSSGFVAGVDPSAAMCRMASRRNRRHVARGLVELRQGRAEALPYPDTRFDKLLSAHTLYFWPDLDRPLAEAYRVLKPGGRLVIAYRNDPEAARSFPASVYHFRENTQIEHALRASGFSGVRIFAAGELTSAISLAVACRPVAP